MPGGGAVFVGTRDGDLEVYADAAAAAGDLEAVDVQDGEYPFACRVDGAVLAIFTEDERVVLDLTGDVDQARLRALIEAYAPSAPGAPRALAPLDFAEQWLDQQWQRRSVRWPRWLDRRMHGSGPPARERLAAPAGRLRPRFVHSWRLRELVDEVVRPLAPAAVSLSEGRLHGRASVRLRPRAPGAVDVLLVYDLWGVDLLVGDSAPIEVSAPRNINYGPPERDWDEDVLEVLRAVSGGQMLIGRDEAGRVALVDIPGSRLGAHIQRSGHLVTCNPAPWT